MKILLSNQIAHFIKFIFLFFLVLGLFLGCEKKEFSSIDIIEQQAESQIVNPDISVNTLNGFDIPDILDEIQLKTGPSSKLDKTQRIVAKNFSIITQGVKKTIPKDGLVTYSFDMEVDGASINDIYNLLVKVSGKIIVDMTVIKLEVDPSTMESLLTSNDNLSLINGSFTTYDYYSFLQDAEQNKIGKNGDCGLSVDLNNSGGGSGVTAPGNSFTISANGINVTADFSHQSLSPTHSYAFTLSVLVNGVVHSATTNASSADVSVFGYNGNLSSNWTSPIGINSVSLSVAAGDPCVITMEYEPVTSGDGTTTFVLVRNMDCGNSKKSSVTSNKLGDCIYITDGFSISTASKTTRKLDYYLPTMLNETQLRLLEKHRASAMAFVDIFLLKGLNDETRNQVLTDIKEWEDELPMEDKIFEEQLAPCLASILNDIKDLDTGISDIIDLFENEIDTTAHVWNVRSGSITSDGNNNVAFTIMNNSQPHTVFNSSAYQRATDLSWAKTILHEAVHAHLLAAPRRDPVFFKRYSDLLNDYKNLVYPDMNDIQHNYFVQNFVDKIATSLKEYADKKGYNASEQYCNDLAWSGLTHWTKRDQNGEPILVRGKEVLEETPWFIDKFPNRSDRDRVMNATQIELTRQDNNGNYRSQKGEDAGC